MCCRLTGSDGTFKPNAKVSRAEFIKMAVDALDLEVAAKKEGEAWYQP
ncbi:S-layer homology domain-containing protein [Paenibacillus wynnii]